MASSHVPVRAHTTTPTTPYLKVLLRQQADEAVVLVRRALLLFTGGGRRGRGLTAARRACRQRLRIGRGARPGKARRY